MAARRFGTGRPKGEPTLPLINIVFLMLIFFLAAAQLARPLDPDLKLVDTSDQSVIPPPDAVVLRADGEVLFRGRPATPTEILSVLHEETDGPEPNVKILPDHRSSATDLLTLAGALKEAGAGAIHVVTEQAL
ncbi:Biopolymer transport protein ExbD/TolR [Tritonibacter multivorans]|uniref:Biopolymer transport protein ExbD/TolR n=1 Tax=Tritonibacter multivorans TaxID=928856 RepID=A0A0P1GTC3_9RHOB|nr:biopolymer transporter ExbD [Tritonibacter multivorans]MDA7422119.1 biopolymer transporter ExbD [Tritonibacter multivorans]CUH78429.1 Biopolymer transport protein ExbD/TolR [Tritonibacter multivorans]SFD16730.1 biopolymer transport protein ExbD [Tritonibacter multivorans]